MFTIQDLHVSVQGQPILHGVNFAAEPGKVHVIMGPNGSGKSTLAHALAGQPEYEVTKGSVYYRSKNLLECVPEARAAAGLFVGFQYPVEISGLSNIAFMKEAYNAIQRANGRPVLDAVDFLARAKERLKLVKLDESFLSRPLNGGFSGGEKKRNEILQLALLEPSLVVLDETDSGLDIDSLKTVADAINSLKSPERTFIIITHYQRLLKYIEPDYVHILHKGVIARSGDASLANQLEQEGYETLLG